MRTQLKGLHVFSSIILFVLLVVTSCSNEDGGELKGKIFYDVASKSSFNLDDQAQLNNLAKALTREVGEIKFLKDAALVDLSDSKGNFKAISVHYQVGEFVTKMIVPINETSVDKKELSSSGKVVKGATYYVRDTEACEMKCTTTEFCTACTQEIIERCKSQTCSCTGGSGGCTGSVIFPPE